MAAESPLVRLWKRIPPSRHAETACCIDGPSRTKSQSRSGCGRVSGARLRSGPVAVEWRLSEQSHEETMRWGRVGREAAGGHAVGGWAVEGDFVLGHWVGATSSTFKPFFSREVEPPLPSPTTPRRSESGGRRRPREAARFSSIAAAAMEQPAADDDEDELDSLQPYTDKSLGQLIAETENWLRDGSPLRESTPRADLKLTSQRTALSSLPPRAARHAILPPPPSYHRSFALALRSLSPPPYRRL